MGNPPKWKLSPYFNIRGFSTALRYLCSQERDLVAAQILDRLRLYLARGNTRYGSGRWWRRCGERSSECFGRSGKLPLSCSIVRSKLGVRNGTRREQAADTEEGWLSAKPLARALLATAILSEGEILLLIRCRCSNRCFAGETESWGRSEKSSAIADYRSGLGRAGEIIEAARQTDDELGLRRYLLYQPAPRCRRRARFPYRAGGASLAAL